MTEMSSLPTQNRRPSQRCGATWTAERCLTEELKDFCLSGRASLVIVAALFSSSGKKTPGHQTAGKGQPPQPALQDNTDNNVQELKNQLQAGRQKEQQATMAAAATADPALASATPQQRAAAAGYGPTGLSVPCIPGQPCPQAQQGNMRCNSRRRNSRHSLSLRKSESALTTPVSLPILCTLALPIRRNSNIKARRCRPDMLLPKGN